MNAGYAIKFVRNQRGLTIPKLAKKAGLSTSYVSLLENNARDPSLSALQKIAGALSVPLSVLIFVATPPAELDPLSPEIAEKLSAATMKLLRDTNPNEPQQSLV